MTVINNYNTTGGMQVRLSDLRVGDVLGDGRRVTGVHVRANPALTGPRRTVWVDTDRGPSDITGRDRTVWIVAR